MSAGETWIPEARWTPEVLGMAAGLTLLLFSVMPLAQWLNRPDVDALVMLRDTEVVTLPPPPPPLLEPTPVPEPTPEPILLMLPAPPPPVPAAPTVDPAFAFEAPIMPGDLGMAFGEMDWAVEGAVYALADVDTPPRAVAQIPPHYPPGARQRGLEGEVLLRFVVTAEGRVEDVEVVDAQPGTVFVSAARSAVERWRFEAAQRAGQPVAVRVEVPLEFKLER